MGTTDAGSNQPPAQKLILTGLSPLQQQHNWPSQDSCMGYAGSSVTTMLLSIAVCCPRELPDRVERARYRQCRQILTCLWAQRALPELRMKSRGPKSQLLCFVLHQQA